MNRCDRVFPKFEFYQTLTTPVSYSPLSPSSHPLPKLSRNKIKTKLQIKTRTRIHRLQHKGLHYANELLIKKCKSKSEPKFVGSIKGCAR
ncbi:hypothetical protein JHK82_017277 [Glycine max]|nr:hypothetical protein JHK86_017327 [Glycine max]KAG5141582.1 hypothetical protein JHK82_017277 [Glycine max]